jgi:hypothetical protein
MRPYQHELREESALKGSISEKGGKLDEPEMTDSKGFANAKKPLEGPEVLCPGRRDSMACLPSPTI